jgi:hypothetical protein
MVDIGLLIPPDMINLISKRGIARKEVKILYANWPKGKIICSDCNYIEKGV